jgi:predicted small secreted protein
MISDKSKHFLLGLTLGVFLSLVGVWAYWYLPAKIQNEKEISFEKTIELIKSKKISEVNVESSRVQLIAKDKNKYYTPLEEEDDAAHEAILRATDESGTKVILLPKSRGLFW